MLLKDDSNIVSLIHSDSSNTPVFSDPWEARAFALTLALSERGLFTLTDFQRQLIARVEGFEKQSCIVEDRDYYTRWLEALNDILEERGILEKKKLGGYERRVQEDAASRKAHQHRHARDEFGRLRVSPIVVDPADQG